MPSRVRLAALGLSQQRPLAHGWYNSGSSNSPGLPDSSTSAIYVIRQCVIGGIEPTSVGSDAFHNIRDHADSASYVVIVPGTENHRGLCQCFRLNVQVRAGARADNDGSTSSELFWNVLGERIR